MLKPGAAICRYRLVDKIGEGGMSEIWRATDLSLERQVAIKFLPETVARDPQRLKMLESEAKTIASINHPNIVTIHSIEECDDGRFIVMELLTGHTLGELIRDGAVPLGRFFDVALPMLEAVAAAHERGVIHRDLKPRNVMIGDSGQVKVLDFGLARSIPRRPGPFDPDADSTVSSLGEGRIEGTIPYMSPEQVDGKTLDTRSDLFSLGVLLYEMIAGRRPFQGDSVARLIASILRDDPPAPSRHRPGIPRQLERIVLRCLEKDPAARPNSARELLAELSAVRQRLGDPNPRALPSIAVLPFRDMSHERDQGYLCEGIAEEIIHALTRVRDLRVTSRTSSFAFKDAAADVRDIGDRLGVGALLEGSVRKADDRLRVTAELVNVGDGYQLWSERYDRKLKDVFAIQDEIAQSIVHALKITLSPGERRAIKQVATDSIGAYEYYLRGRMYFNQYRKRGIQFALQMFSRAIEIDPAFALAHAGLADCRTFLYENADRSEENRAGADEASRRALELDPGLAEAYVSRGAALSHSGRHDEAEGAFDTAIRLNPRLFEAFYYYARDSFRNGRPEKAIELYEKAVELRPEDYQSPLLSAQIYDDLGRHEEAAEMRRKGIHAVEQRLDLNPDDIRALYMGANGLVALGERDKGIAWARRAEDTEPDESMVLYNLGCIYALADAADPALNCLEQAVDQGFAARDWLDHDSNLNSIRKHPRFIALVEKMEQREQRGQV